jgi:type VI secretion system secreted protein Hcp
MAVDIFLKLDGIKGEAQDAKHPQWIDVLSWSWGMTQSGTTHMGPGGGGGKVAVQDLQITKYVDAASPNLEKFCANGKHIANGELLVRKAGENPLEYLSIKMEEIIVTGVSMGGHGTEDRFTEHVTLNFAQFHTTYKPQLDTGGADVAQFVKWHIAKGEEA